MNEVTQLIEKYGYIEDCPYVDEEELIENLSEFSTDASISSRVLIISGV